MFLYAERSQVPVSLRKVDASTGDGGGSAWYTVVGMQQFRVCAGAFGKRVLS